MFSKPVFFKLWSTDIFMAKVHRSVLKLYNDTALCVDFGGKLFMGPGTCPPIIEKRPWIYNFLPPSAFEYFGSLTQYF